MIGEIITQWDESDFYESYEEYCARMKEDYADDPVFLAEILTDEQWIYELQDASEMTWENMEAELTQAMYSLNPSSSYWHCTGTNMGWLHRSGYKNFRAEIGLDLIKACLPDTDKTFTVSHYTDDTTGKQGLHITCSHHDAMGEEYLVFPMTGEEWEEEGEE